MMDSELHLFIIWEKARHKTEDLLNDIREKFQICEIYEVSWSRELFKQNLKRFYGPTLPDPKNKEKLCGNGPFLLILVVDNNPKHGKRGTSIGPQIVNTNVYDTKRKFRNILGGGYPIHGSIHEKEANHDLVMILGKSIEDYKKIIAKKWDNTIRKINKDLIGSNGWKDLEEFFYVLNSTTNYIVLRNFENFPDEIIQDDHKDIDILTDEKWQFPFIANMITYSDNVYHFSPFTTIGQKQIRIDVHFPDDSYYDEKWSKKMLLTKEKNNLGLFIPNHENYFYSLLYHVLIHNKKISEDYSKKLQTIAKDLKLNFSSDYFSDISKLKEILDDFMKNNNFLYTDSIKYKIKHNELRRISKVAIFTINHEGWGYFLRALKGKIKRSI